MNRIIFECQYFKIRIRDIIILFVLLLLLMFLLKGCQHKEIEKKKEEKIINICDFTNENINDLNKLLSRADLCSEGWFQDLDDYITRLEDQNDHLKDKTEKEYQDVYSLQKDLLNDLRKFKNKQSDSTVNKVEQTLKDYKKHYEDKCISSREED